MANINKLLGKRIKEIRKKRGYTQEKLAELLEISASSISKIESGIFHPSEENLENIAKVLNVEIFKLYMFDRFEEKEEIKKELLRLIDSANEKEIKLIYKIVSGILL